MDLDQLISVIESELNIYLIRWTLTDLHNFKDISRTRIVLENEDFVVKIDEFLKPKQVQKEIEFLPQIPDHYAHFFPKFLYHCPRLELAIYERIPVAVEHNDQWVKILRQKTFMNWLRSQGIQRDLMRFDSWRFTFDGKIKIVDFGQ
jgi:hypothetical protein